MQLTPPFKNLAGFQILKSCVFNRFDDLLLMFQGGDVDFSRLVDIIVVELPSWRRIATQYIAIDTKQIRP
jgi:hypothetical protein